MTETGREQDAQKLEIPGYDPLVAHSAMESFKIMLLIEVYSLTLYESW